MFLAFLYIADKFDRKMKELEKEAQAKMNPNRPPFFDPPFIYAPYLPLFQTRFPYQCEFEFVKELPRDEFVHQTRFYFDHEY